MKLLLTSNGLCNPSIVNAFFDLVGKKPEEITLAFIPTAMNATRGDKGWFANDVYNIRKLGLKFFDIVDISALPRKIWEPRLESADVLFFSGGNTSHLMNWMNQSGLKEILPKYLETKVYVGISAGSIASNPTLAFSSEDKKLYYEKEFAYRSEEGLNLVNFYTRPHYNNPLFPVVNKENLTKLAETFKEKFYAIDDESAIKVDGEKIEIISEGEYLEFN